MEEKRVAIETVKLLMQVAWADGDVSETEATHILAYAERIEMGERNLELLRECMAGTRQLPAPDLGFLRQHAAEAMTAAEELVIADEDIAEGEGEVLQELRALLGL